MRLPTLLLLCGLSSQVHAASLCGPLEKAVFNCPVRGKTLSLCAIGTGGDLKLQYRFGPQGKPEFQYPSQPQAPAGHFLASRTAYSGGGESRVRFNNGRYGYMLFESMIRTGFGPAGNNPEITAGVQVRVPGKAPVEIRCRSEATWDWELFEAIPQEDFDYDAR